MIKKNKLSLFLLAVVMMLSIYYINMPEENTVTLPTTSETVVTKYPEFATMRLELLEEREKLVVEFENVLASASTSNSDKNDAYISMQEVLELTENEVLAETFITDLGYVDCFVGMEDQTISVYILNFIYSYEEFEEVCLIVTGIFGANYKVSVKSVSI